MNFESFVFNVKHSKHCIHCEGLDKSVREPKHHPSYEITTNCNLRCVYCYSRVAIMKNTAPKPGYYGDLNPKVVTVSQYGEPLLLGVENVRRVVNFLRKKFGDVRIDLQTNGTFDFCNLDVDIAMVSLDTSNPRSYEIITGSKRFYDVLENIKKSVGSFTLIVRSVHLPGINDFELVELSKILCEIGVDEHFIQPCSVYRECLGDLLSLGFDLERSRSLYEYLRVVYRCGRHTKVSIPGCIRVALDEILSFLDPKDLKFVKRESIARSPPKIRREWRFSITQEHP